jgi:hypothetical protein
MTMKLTDEQIAAIRDGCEGVTPGPWHIHPVDDTTIITLERTVVATTCDSAATEREDSYNVEYERMGRDALHIARCDPDTIRALATEVLEGRATIARLTRDQDAAIVALGEWARKAGALENRVAADAMIKYGLAYDQSGSGRNGTQTTPANQPQIVANGATIPNSPETIMSIETLYVTAEHIKDGVYVGPDLGAVGA